MIDFCQLRVEDLHRRLDESLSAFQKSVNRKDNAQARGLHCVKQNSKEVLIEVVQVGSKKNNRLFLTHFVMDLQTCVSLFWTFEKFGRKCGTFLFKAQ